MIGEGLTEQTRTFGDVEVTVQKMPVMEALAMVPKVHQLADISSMDGELLQDFTRRLFRRAFVVKGERRIDLGTDKGIEQAFAGDWATLLLAIGFAAQVNFSGFFVARPQPEQPAERSSQDGQEGGAPA